MIHERNVREKIASVLQSEISIVDFVRWIMSNSWNMHQDSSAAAVALVSRIHLLLAERDEQAIDDAKFLNELRALQADIPEPNMVYGISVRIDIDKISPAEFPVASVNSLQFPEIQIPLPV